MNFKNSLCCSADLVFINTFEVIAIVFTGLVMTLVTRIVCSRYKTSYADESENFIENLFLH